MQLFWNIILFCYSSGLFLMRVGEDLGNSPVESEGGQHKLKSDLLELSLRHKECLKI